MAKGRKNAATATASAPGMNRTGIGTSPKDAKTMIEGAEKYEPSSPGDKTTFATFRAKSYGNGVKMGTVPPPTSIKGVVKTVAEAISGNHPTVFIDKLAERLAFERSGTRLYETLLTKLDIKGGFEGGPSRADLERIHQDEAQHFALLKECLEKLGADPTAVTPSANLAAVESMGVMQVVNDARTDLGESLHAMLVAELVDVDAWDSLVLLADKIGQSEIAERFREAGAEETEHLSMVRGWLQAYGAVTVSEPS